MVASGSGLESATTADNTTTTTTTIPVFNAPAFHLLPPASSSLPFQPLLPGPFPYLPSLFPDAYVTPGLPPLDPFLSLPFPRAISSSSSGGMLRSSRGSSWGRGEGGGGGEDRGRRGGGKERTSGDLECVFCKKNGEMKEFYNTHVLKDPNGMVVCPVLRAYVCPKCGATGYHAHTVSHCPLAAPRSKTVVRRRRKSCGEKTFLPEHRLY